MDTDYDLVIAGGSIAGAALGFAAQRAGARVLIVEPESAFRDRVRGESLHPWGVAEAQRLGLTEVLERAPSQPADFWDTYIGGQRVERRDLAATTPARLPERNVHHPELQTALLDAARAAGVEVRCGAKVVHIDPGVRATIVLAPVEGRAMVRHDEAAGAPARSSESSGDRTTVTARLAVIADGRHSPLRMQLGIAVTGDPMPMLTSGVLLEDVGNDPTAVSMFSPREFGALALVLALPRNRVRLYFIHRRDSEPSVDRSSERRAYSGAAQLPALLQRCLEVGVPPSWFARARASGPLATFETTCWSLRDAELPRGVALIGDAAGNVDPVFGCGQSLALRDVRHLIEAARECRYDWQLAASRYIQQRRGYHASLLRIESWLSRILFTPSPQGDAIRAAAFPRLEQLGVDLIGLGPDSSSDDATEAQLFAS